MKDNRKGEGDFLYKKRIIEEKLERIKRLAFFVRKYKDNRELIEDYSAEIEKVSEQIELLLEDISHSNMEESEKQKRQDHLEKKNILLAMPEGPKEKQLMEILHKVQVTVFWVTEGKKALDAYIFSRSGTFDAVLLDVHVPNKNGFLVAKAIRSCEKKNAGWIPLIALLDDDNKDDIRRAQEAGMDGWLSAPFSEKEVVAVIFKFIQKVSVESNSQIM